MSKQGYHSLVQRSFIHTDSMNKRSPHKYVDSLVVASNRFVGVNIVQLFLGVVRPEGWLVERVDGIFGVGILVVLQCHLIVGQEGLGLINFFLIAGRNKFF